MLSLITHMLKLQEQMNTLIHPEWRTRDFPWYRAIWTESAEMLDHHGWKWWKHQQPNWQQIHLEIIDIWHFGLSDLLQDDMLIEHTALHIVQLLEIPKPEFNHSTDFLNIIENFATECLAQKRFSIIHFKQLIEAANLDIDQLFKWYVGKNLLNEFRQLNGYKDGSYRKYWNGKEDNEVLAELVEQFNLQDDSTAIEIFSNQIRLGLKQAYESKIEELT
ncbi:MAG: dUTP diphosphatase [Pseudomonadota bacterium]